MANYKARFPSSRLEQEDLRHPSGKGFIEMPAVIATLAYEKVGEDQKTVVYFQGLEKSMVLNWTNACTLADLYGDDDDDWIGREIVIWVDPTVMYAGKRTGGLRFKAPQRAPERQPVQQLNRPGDLARGTVKTQSGSQAGIIDEDYQPPDEAR